MTAVLILFCIGLASLGIWAYDRSQKAITKLQKDAYQKLIDDRNKVLQERKERLLAENKTFREYKLAECKAIIEERFSINKEVDDEDKWILPNEVAIQNFIQFVDLFEAGFPNQDFEIQLEGAGDIECYIEQEGKTFMGEPIVVLVVFSNSGVISCWMTLASIYFENDLTMDQIIPKVKEFLNK